VLVSKLEAGSVKEQDPFAGIYEHRAFLFFHVVIWQARKFGDHESVGALEI
jgi:hypothetical protein